MILFTKEVLLHIKTLNTIQVRGDRAVAYRDDKQQTELFWTVFITGSNFVSGNNNNYDSFEHTIECANKEDAYRIYKELVEQVVDSGEIPKLTDKQFDDVLNEEKAVEK